MTGEERNCLTGTELGLLAELEKLLKEVSEERKLKREVLNKFADYCIERNGSLEIKDAQLAALRKALEPFAAEPCTREPFHDEHDCLDSLNPEHRRAPCSRCLARKALASGASAKLPTDHGAEVATLKANRSALLKFPRKRLAALAVWYHDALAKYGCHLANCSFGVADLAERNKRGECGCGLMKALKPPAAATENKP